MVDIDKLDSHGGVNINTKSSRMGSARDEIKEYTNIKNGGGSNNPNDVV